MSNQEILTKAIEKAIAGGFDPTPLEWDKDTSAEKLAQYYSTCCTINEAYELFYNHDFAKALWGDNDDDRMVIIGETNWRKWPLPWQYHLQKMVIADDPIKYLGDNI